MKQNDQDQTANTQRPDPVAARLWFFSACFNGVTFPQSYVSASHQVSSLLTCPVEALFQPGQLWYGQSHIGHVLVCAQQGLCHSPEDNGHQQQRSPGLGASGAILSSPPPHLPATHLLSVLP